ncbi:MAG: SEC-C domain-containing protein [Phycisphaerales bacterium]|nr:SEC-C domain-containing protein [Phycisphaerales bacterium]
MDWKRCGFQVTRKRRMGFPSETNVKRGERGVHTSQGFKEFVEKLGRNDPCPCGSMRRFQGVLPEDGSVLTGRTAASTRGEQ